MKGKGWVVFAIVGVFVLGSVFSGFAQEKITWRMQSSWPKGIEAQYQADLFAKRVTDMSGGPPDHQKSNRRIRRRRPGSI